MGSVSTNTIIIICPFVTEQQNPSNRNSGEVVLLVVVAKHASPSARYLLLDVTPGTGLIGGGG